MQTAPRAIEKAVQFQPENLSSFSQNRCPVWPEYAGICERFHKTILDEFYRVTFRRKLYTSLDELQADLDDWIRYYNNDRTHQGKECCGRTPMQTMIDGKEAYNEKVNALN